MTLNGTAQVFDFVEEYNSSTSYLFSGNTIKKGVNNFCYSNAEKLHPLAEYEITVKRVASYASIRDFFIDVNGGQDTFCFLDPIDHYADHNQYDTGLGVKTWGVVANVDGTLRLVKKYILETGSGNFEVTRIITRPKENDITVYDVNGNANVSIDWDTGIVLSGALEGFTWSGYFYTPVRFANDLLPLKAISFREDELGQYINDKYDLESIVLREVKEEHEYYGAVLTDNYAHNWQLGFERTYSSDLNTKTDVYTDGSGFEKRTATSAIEVETSFPDLQRLNYAQKEYLIGLWRVCLGSHSNFIIDDTLGTGYNGYFYFAEPFTLEPQSYQSEFQQVFLARGLKFKEVLTKLNTYYCHCWLLTRKDGQQYAFTNHDLPLTINGIVYKPKGSYQPSSPSRTAESDQVQDVDLASYLTDEITEEEIISGRFLDTQVEIFYYDWQNAQELGRLFTGQIKSWEVAYLPSGANSYKFIVKSHLENLNVEVKVETSSTCRAKFLSEYCGRTIDTTVRQTRTITNLGVNTNILTVFVSANSPDYDRGLLTFTSGKLLGVTVPIVRVANGNEVQLLYKPPILPEVGDTVELTKRCDKTPLDCVGYGNIANFRGEPSVPGMDRIRANPAFS